MLHYNVRRSVLYSQERVGTCRSFEVILRSDLYLFGPIFRYHYLSLSPLSLLSLYIYLVSLFLVISIVCFALVCPHDPAQIGLGESPMGQLEQPEGTEN